MDQPLGKFRGVANAFSSGTINRQKEVSWRHSMGMKDSKTWQDALFRKDMEVPNLAFHAAAEGSAKRNGCSICVQCQGQGSVLLGPRPALHGLNGPPSLAEM